MVLLCAGLWIFRCVGKFPENSQEIHTPEASTRRKWGQRAARGAPGALLARPTPWPRRGAFWGGPTPPGALLGPLFLPVTRKFQKKTFFRSTSWSRHHPLFFLGRANLEAVLASGEGKSSPSSSPSPLHHPSKTSPFMCE